MILASAYVAVSLSSCGPTHRQKEGSIDQSTTDGITIRRSDYGADWPFTVDEGILKCESNRVILVVENKIYALNGTAKNQASTYGYITVDEIWAYDSLVIRKLAEAGLSKEQVEKAKTRVSIGQIITDGVKLCK